MVKKILLLTIFISIFTIFLGLTFYSSSAKASPIFAATDKKCEVEPITRENCGIVDIVVTVIRVLSGLVGIVVVVMIAYGGVQYSLARDNPQAVSAAKSKIVNAILALVFYLMIFGFLQWVVPGGVL